MNGEHKVDRTDWNAGPWDNEPDRIEWRYEGFPCLIVRNSMGALCGYVGTPLGSKLGDGSYDDLDVAIHGGLTFAGACSPNSPICHVPEPGEPEVYWYGFDCAHVGDYCPSNSRYARGRKDGLFEQGTDVYRDVAYVTTQVQKLADQLKGILEKT